MFYVLLCITLFVHFNFVISLTGKRGLVALYGVSPWWLVIVMWLLLTVPWVCLQVVIVVFSDHTHLQFVLKKLSLQL